MEPQKHEKSQRQENELPRKGARGAGKASSGRAGDGKKVPLLAELEIGFLGDGLTIDMPVRLDLTDLLRAGRVGSSVQSRLSQIDLSSWAQANPTGFDDGKTTRQAINYGSLLQEVPDQPENKCRSGVAR